MNIKMQLDFADALAELWKGLLPNADLPSRQQFLMWADLAPENIVTFAFNKVAVSIVGRRWTSTGCPDI